MVDFKATQKRSIPVPARLKCCQCEKWKISSFFSNKQQKVFQRGDLKVKCIDCSSDQRQELECEGPCGNTKDISKFSKSSRKAGGRQWCMECTNWMLGYETSVQVGPAPVANLAPDERYGSTLAIAGLYDGDDYATEDGGSTAPGVYETGNKIPWYKKGNEKSEVPTAFENASEVTGQMGALKLENEHPYQPPHLRGRGYKGPLNKPIPAVPRSENTPSFSTTSVTTASNPYDSEPDDDWRTVAPPARRKDPIAFNGYDNAGQRHSQQKHPGSGTGSASTTTQEPTWNAQFKRASTPVMRNSGPPVSSAQSSYSHGPEGDEDDSDDDHYYD